MTPELERAAVVLNDAYRKFGHSGHLRTQPLSEECARELARAVIASLDPPTDARVEAAAIAVWQQFVASFHGRAVGDWEKTSPEAKEAVRAEMRAALSAAIACVLGET